MHASYQRLLESTKDGIYRYSFQDRCIIETNQGFIDILDLKAVPNDLVGMNLSEIMNLSDEEECAVELALEKEGELHGYTYHFKTLKGDDRWVIHDAVLIKEDARNIVETIVKDITPIKQAEILLRMLVESAARNTGELFFRSLVSQLAAGLGVDGAFVGEVLPDNPGRIRTLAVHRNGNFEDNFEYDIKGTPCEKIKNDPVCWYPSGVTRSFPAAKRLADWNVNGFAGIRLLLPTGTAAGVLAIVSSKPLPEEEHLRSVLELFGVRVGAEIERERTVAALRENELHFRRLLSSVTNYVYTVTIRDGRPVSTTHGIGCETVTGYSPDDYQNDPNLWYRMIHEDDKVSVISHANRILSQPGPLTLEHRLVHRNGSIRWVRNTLVQKYDADGAMIAYDGIVSDITERKDAEVALRESEARHRGIVETAAEGIWWLDEHGATTFVNEHMARLLGYRVDQMYGRKFIDLLDGESRAEAQSFLASRSKGVRESRDLCFSRPDGSCLWTIVSMTPVVDTDGRYRGALAMVSDITERKKNEQELARLAAAVNAAEESIVITDMTGEILFVNPCFERVTGYKRDEVLHKNTRILQSGKHTKEFYADLWQKLNANGVWHGRFTNRRKDLTLFEEDATISPIRDASGKIINYISVKRDISKEVMLEDEIRHAQKLTEIGVLVKGIAHKLINRFTSILAQGDFVRPAITGNSLVMPHYESMMNDLGWCAKLCQELLAFAVRQHVKIHPQKIGYVVQEALDILKDSMFGDVTFAVLGMKNTTIVNYDLPQIKQVIVNMVNNAKEVTPPAGCVTVEATTIVLDRNMLAQITRGTEPESDKRAFAAISVSDSGRGIPQDAMKRVFEPFFTTVDGSLGLGLPVCYGIVKKHNGMITCYTREGYGTTFTIYIPAVQQPAAAAVDKEEVPQELRGNERILVVDDNVLDRTILVRILQQLGYSVVEAESAQHAIEVATQFPEPINLLITDAVMPLTAGSEIAKAVLSMRPDMKVLFYSGFPLNHLQNHPILKDAGIVLSKPFLPLTVAKAVREALAGKG